MQLDMFSEAPKPTTRRSVPAVPPPSHGLRPYQEEAVKGALRELDSTRSTLIVMPTGCHAPGQKVLRLDGALVAVENVRIGDLLMGPDSKPREVLCLHHGIGEMVAICPTKGSPWTVNRGHILTLVRTNDVRKPGLVCDVSVDEWSRWSRTHKHVHKLFRTGVDFPQAKPLPVDPYFLGLWLGDGQKRLDSLCIFNKDPEVFAYLESFAESNGLVYRRSADGDKCPRLSIVGKRWRENPVLYAIREILGDGFKIRVPTPVLSASKRDRLQALAGLMDSDGSLSGGGFDFISIERELADGVSFLARSVGLAAYVSKTKKTCQTGAVGDYWRVSISGDCAMVPTKIARKKADTRQQKKDVLRTGFSTEAKEDGEYFGFQLSGDGRYLLDDFTVTHNSGKTRVMTEIAQRRKQDRILVLAHRDELLQQAVDRFARDCGERVGLDKAESFAYDQRIVVGSIQTVSMPTRLERFDPKRFDLVMVDECHHATAPTYKRVLDYFGDAKVLGVTATPDRADEKAMGQVFDSVAFLYEIEDAINDGYLCDVRCSRIEIAGLDLSNVKTTAGDLNQGDLDAVMAIEEVLLGVADATIREAGKRKTLLFTTSVANADKLAEILNRHRDGCARAVNGKTEIDERRGILKAHQAGDYQFLCNVGIATEGYDDPSISCVAIARPTKSRALYTQMCGRGLRIFDGKPDCLLIDYVGNSGRHKLASALDVLGGRYTEEEEELAQKIVEKNPGMKARDAIDEAHAQAEREKAELEKIARLKAIKAKAIYSKQDVNPFGIFHLDVQREQELAERFGGKIASDKQIACLQKFKIPVPAGCTSQLASKLIGTAITRRQKDLASFGQLKTLQKYGVNDINISFKHASTVIDAIAQNQWRPLPFANLDAIMGSGSGDDF
jgi:superfamily II DNA or RNA helicase